MMITFRLSNLVSPENQKSSTEVYISTQLRLECLPGSLYNKSWMCVINQGHSHTAATNRTHGHIRPQATWHPSLSHILLKGLTANLDLENRTRGWQSRGLILAVIDLFLDFLLI